MTNKSTSNENSTAAGGQNERLVMPRELAERILGKMQDDLQRIIGEWGAGEDPENEIENGSEPEIAALKKLLGRAV